MNERLILEKIEQDKNDYINFLRNIVQTKSFNPPGSEKEIALKIKDYLERVNIRSEIYLFGENRANLIAYLNDNFKGKNLLYNGHMDTVPPGTMNDWKYPPLSGSIEDNKVMFGRGTSDMKAGLAAMVISLKILKELDIELSGNLIVNAVADEETGGFLGTKWCIDNKLKSIKTDFAVVGEYTGLTPLPKAIMVGEKGQLQVKVITCGKSCHASVPFMGINPIDMMSNIIQNLNLIDMYIEIQDPPISKSELERLLSSNFTSKREYSEFLQNNPIVEDLFNSVTGITKTFTMLNSGVKENIVPDRCEAIINFRFLPNHKKEMIISALQQVITDLGYSVKEETEKEETEKDGIYVSIEPKYYTEASYFKDWENSETLKTFYTIVHDIYKIKPLYFIFPASADAEYLRNKNYCPDTILFGPGSFENAHTVDEHIELQDFFNAIKVYTLFAYNFLHS